MILILFETNASLTTLPCGASDCLYIIYTTGLSSGLIITSDNSSHKFAVWKNGNPSVRDIPKLDKGDLTIRREESSLCVRYI